MDKYTIYCTEAQAKKALEFGATRMLFVHGEDKGSYKPIDEYTDAIIPTADRMIGWLEERGIFISINHIGAGYSSWLKTISTNENISENLGYVSTRKEATIAAIDAALEYLSKNMK